MLPLITVVIPVYNVEKYLRRCIDSILAQTYTRLEIILVDDGSPDRCPEICDEYAAKYAGIKVIHKENGGLSSARNAGIDASVGEYIAFVDSDDMINVSMISELYRILSENTADISVCGIKYIYEGENADISQRCGNGSVRIMSGIDAVKTTLGRKRSLSVPSWNKLYRKKLFDGIRFPLGKIHEDEYTTYRLFFKSERVAFISTPMYLYLQRKKSIMHSGKITANYVIEALTGFERYCTENISDEAVRGKLLDMALSQRADIILDAYYRSSKLKLSEEAKHYSSLYREISPELSRKGIKKLKFRLFDISPALFRLAFRVNVMLHGREMSQFR